MAEQVFRAIAKEQFDLLKAASNELVNLVGDVTTAAALADTTHSRISESISPFQPKRSLSLLQIAEMEVTLKKPVVTTVLAQLLGARVEVIEPGKVLPPSEVLAQVCSYCGHFESSFARATSDNKITPKEKKDLLAQLAAARAALDAAEKLLHATGGGR